jgi:hypothetical protein
VGQVKNQESGLLGRVTGNGRVDKSAAILEHGQNVHHVHVLKQSAILLDIAGKGNIFFIGGEEQGERRRGMGGEGWE